MVVNLGLSMRVSMWVNFGDITGVNVALTCAHPVRASGEGPSPTVPPNLCGEILFACTPFFWPTPELVFVDRGHHTPTLARTRRCLLTLLTVIGKPFLGGRYDAQGNHATAVACARETHFALRSRVNTSCGGDEGLVWGRREWNFVVAASGSSSTWPRVSEFLLDFLWTFVCGKVFLLLSADRPR